MTRPQPDAGFTLIELLVVLVIMPLVVGAIAAAIIISERDTGVASSRLSDSSSAQIISEYYVRDVQGAAYVTTYAAASSPAAVCVDPSVSSPTLVVGLYRPATATSAVLSVGYWLTPSGSNLQLVRYSCDSGGTVTSQAVINNDFTAPDQVTATIAPQQFDTAAALGWTATTTTSPPASISNITISLMEPGSSYAYTLPASPRAWTSSVSFGAVPGSAFALVSLFGNVTVSNPASITVDGNVKINGTLQGTGLTAPGYTIQQHAGVTDPLAPYLPNHPDPGPAQSTCNITTATQLNPGTYTCQLKVTGTGNAQLNPGVYNLEGGINVLGGGQLTYVGPPGSGVLLYLPCQGPPNGCNESATFASGASVDLPPLNASQSVAASRGASVNANTAAMQDMWFWQDAIPGTPSKLIGNGQGGLTSGIAYIPNSSVDLSNNSGSDATGEIVTGAVTMSGSASLTITGQ